MTCFSVLCCLVMLYLTGTAPVLENNTLREVGGEIITSLYSNSTKCPTWYVPSTQDPTRCMCGDTLMNATGKVVECYGDQRVSVILNYCMSFNESAQQTLVGSFPYANAQNKTLRYIEQPQNRSDLNSELCSWVNREGFMCHKCRSGGVSVFNYEHVCVKCLGKIKGCDCSDNIVPTTLFFLLVVTCRIRSTAAHMNGMLCLLQVWVIILQGYVKLRKVQSAGCCWLL